MYIYTNPVLSLNGLPLRPFYQYRGHIELTGLRSIMGCPGGAYERSDILAQCLRALLGAIFLKIPLE